MTNERPYDTATFMENAEALAADALQRAERVTRALPAHAGDTLVMQSGAMELPATDDSPTDAASAREDLTQELEAPEDAGNTALEGAGIRKPFDPAITTPRHLRPGGPVNPVLDASKTEMGLPAVSDEQVRANLAEARIAAVVERRNQQVKSPLREDREKFLESDPGSGKMIQEYLTQIDALRKDLTKETGQVFDEKGDVDLPKDPPAETYGTYFKAVGREIDFDRLRTDKAYALEIAATLYEDKANLIDTADALVAHPERRPGSEVRITDPEFTLSRDGGETFRSLAEDTDSQGRVRENVWLVGPVSYDAKLAVTRFLSSSTYHTDDFPVRVDQIRGISEKQ